MQQYEHLIVGSGLIGCYLGAVIGLQGRVRFVGRAAWLTRLQAGIALTDFAGHRATCQVTPDACLTAIPESLANTIIWLTVKNTALEKVLTQLHQAKLTSCVVICCQNGLGATALARRYLPGCMVMQGIVGCNVIWEEASTTLHKATEGALYIEHPGRHADALQHTLLKVNHGLLEVIFRDDIEAVAWAKLQLNLANSVNAIVNQPVKSMLLDSGCRDVIALLMDEFLAVAAARQITLPRLTRVPAHWLPRLLRLPTWLFKRIASTMLHIDPKARSSMWWDIEAGCQTEIDYLNGALIELGEQLGVSCAVNKRVVDCVKALERVELVAQRTVLDGITLKIKLHLK